MYTKLTRAVLALLLTFPFLVQAQKIKIKKDVVLFDGNEVAKVNTEMRDNFLFTTLSGEKAFDVVFKGLSASNTEGFQWLELTAADGKKTEVPYEILMTSLSQTKLIIKLLSAKYGLITSDGIPMETVADFFAQDREMLSDTYGKTVLAARNDQAERKAKVGRLNPFVKDDGTVLFGGPRGTDIVGRVSYGNNAYRVSDLDGNTIGTATGCSTCTTVKAKTYTDEEFTFDEGSKTMMKGRFSRTLAQTFVEELVGRDYTLGHEAKTYMENLKKEKIRVAKENSINLYGVPGVVIDEDGTRYEGTLYAIFEPLQLDPTQQERDLYDMNSVDKFGKFVSVKYRNEKGRIRTKRFSAKDNIEFRVPVENGEIVFHGMKTKGNALKKLANAANFGFDNSYFYQEEYKNGENKVLSKPGSPEQFVLQFSDNPVGFMIDERGNGKVSEALSEFIGGCSSLAEDLQQGQFDLNNFENLKTIVDEYSGCK